VSSHKTLLEQMRKRMPETVSHLPSGAQLAGVSSTREAGVFSHCTMEQRMLIHFSNPRVLTSKQIISPQGYLL
jgi:hypothetical protein